MGDYNEERMEEAYDEAELSDDEFEEQSFDNLLDRVGSNDPSLTKLKVRLRTLVQDNDDNRHRLDRLSTAIGRNTQLKALMLDTYRAQLDETHTMNLFRGIACSRSIKRFYFSLCRASSVGNACRILTPLFKNNQVERVWFNNCELNTECIRLLATSLAEFDSLKEFALTLSDLKGKPGSEQLARELMQALSGHSGLRKLDLSNTNVGKLGCAALADLLSNPNISLKVLDLASNDLGDAEAVALSSGMAGNTTLKEINLASNWGITETGWQAIFYALSRTNCRLEKLTLLHNWINDAAAQSLSNALASNTTLKTLDLGYTRGITLTGWCVMFDFLQSLNCALEDLDLSINELSDEAMTSLIGALASNVSLKSLNLSSNRGVTGAGWQRFFSAVLTNHSSELERLDLCYCYINDAAIRGLTIALVNNSKLKVLILNGDDLGLITNTGWEGFSAVLESPHSALEKLDLKRNNISDATLTSLVNTLANNKKLKKFLFHHSKVWEPNLGVLCNSDSIMSTYNSNHILEELGYGHYLPVEFESLLQINRENSPSQAARLKIIKTHFKEGFVTQPFVDINLNVLPYAMAWMSRDGRVGEVCGDFYSFIKSISSLFENVERKINKRKTDSD